MSSLFKSTVQLSELDSIVQQIKLYLKTYNILCLKGDLGTGKTTFTQKLLLELGYKNAVNSPTFNLLNEYKLQDNSMVYHFDLYRLKNQLELYEFGFQEYIDSNNLCIIEWPEISESMLPLPYLELHIQHFEDARVYELTIC